MATTHARTRRTTIGAGLVLTLTALLSVSTASPAAAGGTVFADGFEQPQISTDFVTFGKGQALGPWTVTSGNVDLTSDWQAAEGGQSLDLNGDQPGSVARTVPTSLLTTYRVTYALAGNPDGGAIVTTGTVTANGATVDSFSFDTAGHSPSDMGYVHRTFYFTNLLSASTTLQFGSTTASVWGPVIDGVRVDSCLLVICPSGAGKSNRLS
ncbi:DUF642 domain-containing protein [Micromonospora sp. NPDC049559]|uniref:DUF642 domain-containing protein n=1 Tax=Micromonospora sp. NPDC049559 TaxID=3155923 RepID=UPI003418B1C5